MTKQAAEQIAQQYYQLGSQLALEGSGLTKEASRMKQLAKLLGVSGAAGGTALAGANAPDILNYLLGPAGVSKNMMAKAHTIEDIIRGATAKLPDFMG